MSVSRPFTISPALTGIAIGYRNPTLSLIADKLFPIVAVAGEAFKWLEYPLAQGFTVPNNEVSRKGRVENLEFKSKEVDASVKDYGLQSSIPMTDITTARAQREQKLSIYDPEMEAAEELAGLNLLARELRVAKKVQDPNSYAPERQMVLSGSSMFSDPSSDPITVLTDAINGTLVHRANKLQMGYVGWKYLRRHPKIVNAVRGNLTSQGIITRKELADLLEIEEIIVGESFVNLGLPGQATNLQRTWGNSMSAVYIDASATTKKGITFGLTAQFGTNFAGHIEDPDIGVYGGYQIRVGGRMLEFSPAKDVGYLIQNAVPLV
jgi:hypothetical protein